jgi:hypothetical protein
MLKNLSILFIALFCQLFAASPLIAQDIDTVVKPTLPTSSDSSSALIANDSLHRSVVDSTGRKDSVARVVVVPAVPDTTLQHFYKKNQHIAIDAPLVFRNEEPYFSKEKDMVFYLLAGMLLVLGMIRLIFSKYFSDLFKIFFKTSFRQKSIRDQLLQNTMASLLMNIFFCVSGGLFLYFVARYNGWLTQKDLWEKAGICIALVSVVYGTKYIGLQVSGWLFGMKEVTETYLFIVFLINKVVGVMLLPTVIILSLGSQALHPVLLVCSLILLLILYLYRYIIALPLVRTHSGLTGFHFFIYLCAFEIVPLLLIYKLLILILSR